MTGVQDVCSSDLAESAVKRLYRNSDVVLSADDYAGTEIVVELPPISSADAILDLR